ncbi:hypothetical protein A2334_05180 [Candidatus Roizmanbacteria bacterium RIFOXYB2_FULL_38_10]|uniref:Glycosyl transferase family 1 domain-containing protein n=1 Tax=Candidatus Roizmanbacteria bacterium RIFOXYD1_FULL_38_12 TaxID=1802093 RepID=A0A1F7KZU9_9BACT|nr:MAG: hypothetical protein A3K47_01280 [Candidatus Roizmanbacteria bacterium RIFOXYA2_FULL_38_14]OGK63417.1 MAG: hypothetical protein A3K27_01280 [Candidatus Roizmanbacteria bacterium RIFOXYA1_FULL_37_12]OGK65263.1 MAG: hypothetical protein A3K38_01280 [Candidatus Roizmanbacteria bacterium RIFOXYB1_FULL_40_23]OGK68816.1 MAG: hypothetical protein A2334_05180 [Candidatus Roizmanbacteria bacterium RIFOXYB2_FULL_38_10]OGK69668.1 MAG: hypothetical protein A3K21_01285 [Candidatus Roizmanbacteria ba
MVQKEKKVAIVYDWIDKWGGVERLLLVLHHMFPSAPFFTSYVDLQSARWARGIHIKSSFIQHLPRFIKKSRLLSFFFYPLAFESFDFSEYDTVISVSSSFAKSIITKPNTHHICILLTPTRYLWLYPTQYLGVFLVSISAKIIDFFKKWDKIASRRPDNTIAISHEVSKRCLKYYGFCPPVIYPPFDLQYWVKVKKSILDSNYSQNTNVTHLKQFYLVVARLEPYKKVDVVIRAFKGRKDHLVVVGKGSLLQKMKRRAGKNVLFMEDLSDEDLGSLYSNAQALIMPQHEDFGYVALEAQFFGCPVIAYDKGGSKETIMDGKTGIFFHEQTHTKIRAALERWDKISYNLRHHTRQYGEENATFFSKEHFEKSLYRIINCDKPKQA